MTTTSLIVFEENKAKTWVDYRNSWGGAARIWTTLFDKYCKDPSDQFDNWLFSLSPLNEKEDTRLWDLVTSDKLRDFECAVHLFTFDRFLVKRENFKRFSGHLTDFVDRYPVRSVDHLESWAKDIESLIPKENITAVGLCATNVVDCLWFEENEDSVVPYDISTGSNHYEVYEELERIKNQCKDIH